MPHCPLPRSIGSSIRPLYDLQIFKYASPAAAAFAAADSATCLAALGVRWLIAAGSRKPLDARLPCVCAPNLCLGWIMISRMSCFKKANKIIYNTVSSGSGPASSARCGRPYAVCLGNFLQTALDKIRAVVGLQEKGDCFWWGEKLWSGFLLFFEYFCSKCVIWD